MVIRKLKRQIVKHSLPIPKNIAVPKEVVIPFEDISHVPGESAAIRFFDPDSREDLEGMREILKGKQSKKWMDDTTMLSKSEYDDWARTVSNMSFLFAVLDASHFDNQEVRKVRGFVYIYSEREEKFRVKRMEKMGFIKPTTKPRHLLEISFAARPMKYGAQSGSGLVSSAVRQSCLQVRTLLNSLEKMDVEIFAFCDPENMGAQRTVEASGFERKGLMYYDSEADEKTILYILNWKKLQEKVRGKLLAVLEEHIASKNDLA